MCDQDTQTNKKRLVLSLIKRRRGPSFGFRWMLHGLAFAAALVLFADVAQAQPAAPTGLLTVPFSESVMLFWDDPNDSSITGYELSIDNGTFNAINPTLFEDGDLCSSIRCRTSKTGRPTPSPCAR